MIQQGVILADAVLTSFQLRLFHQLHIWHQLQLLFLELFGRYKPGSTVHLSITCPLKPSKNFIIKAVDVYVSPSCEEVVLHIFHDSLGLAFAGWIVWHAEDRFEANGFYILGKLLCHDIVSVVLVYKHSSILIVHDLLGNSSEVSERKMMRIDS